MAVRDLQLQPKLWIAIVLQHDFGALTETNLLRYPIASPRDHEPALVRVFDFPIFETKINANPLRVDLSYPASNAGSDLGNVEGRRCWQFGGRDEILSRTADKRELGKLLLGERPVLANLDFQPHLHHFRLAGRLCFDELHFEKPS